MNNSEFPDWIDYEFNENSLVLKSTLPTKLNSNRKFDFFIKDENSNLLSKKFELWFV